MGKSGVGTLNGGTSEQLGHDNNTLKRFNSMALSTRYQLVLTSQDQNLQAL